MIILKGAPVSQKIQADILQELAGWNLRKIKFPHLSVILVGEDPASSIYVTRKEDMCKKLGFSSEIIRVSTGISQRELQNIIIDLNKNSSVDGILVQLPLPVSISAREVLETIDPLKDVDCLTEKNLGKILTGHPLVQPCTPSGVMEMLKHYNISVQGKNVAIIGRSLIVGVPLIHLLLKENASVSVFHSKSEKIESQLKNFDIVCVAVGKSHAFKYSQFKHDAVVIDVGINRSSKGLTGDVLNDMTEGKNHIKAATPVPGGVGVMTIAMLMKNTLALAKLRRNAYENLES